MILVSSDKSRKALKNGFNSVSRAKTWPLIVCSVRSKSDLRDAISESLSMMFFFFYIYRYIKRNACRLELEKKSLTFLQFSLLAFAKLHTQIRPAPPQHYTRRLLWASLARVVSCDSLIASYQHLTLLHWWLTISL